MALNAPSAAEVKLLEYITGKSSPGSPVLKLFSSDTAITDSSVVGDFTETTITGYSAKTLTSASWTVSDVAGVGTATYAAQSFTFSGSGTVYGYTVQSSGGSLLWAEKFSDGPYVFPSGGGTLTVTPTVTLD